jgi:uncharacterized protein (TIGR00297 family)
VIHRKVNIFFILSLVFVFIIYGEAQDHQQILLGVFFALLLSMCAFLFNWLTIDGAFSATICGSYAYGIGGMTGAAVVLFFFISSSVLTKKSTNKEKQNIRLSRRNGIQVWANGFWFSIWFLVWFLTDIDLFLIAGVTAVASITADTWATEIGGNRLQSKARLITTGKTVPPGTDGGVSFTGTISSIAGAAMISITYFTIYGEFDLGTVLIIGIAGFMGSIIDSYLGARFQYNSEQKHLSLGEIKFNMDNNFVNWFSSGLASVISLLATLIISL